MESHLHVVPEHGESDGPAPIRVALADEHVVMRAILRQVLEAESDIAVVGEAGDLESAVRIVNRQRPDVLVVEMRLPPGSGVEVVGMLCARAPETRIVVASMEYDPAFAQSVLEAGAVGFVSKDLADSELPSAVRAAANSERYVSPRVSALLEARQARRS
jgi:DNA-binding NarL/FixJ family response regulator